MHFTRHFQLWMGFGLLAATLPARAAEPGKPAPVIFCAQPEYRFGSVNRGAEVKHTFVIKNKGKGVLKIERTQGG